MAKTRLRAALTTLAALALAGCDADPAAPHRAEATLFARAAAAAQSGDHETAVRHFDALIASASRPEYHLARGMAHLRAGSAPRAADDAAAGLALDPDTAARRDLEWLAAEAGRLMAGRPPTPGAVPPSWMK